MNKPTDKTQHTDTSRTATKPGQQQQQQKGQPQRTATNQPVHGQPQQTGKPSFKSK